MQLMLSAELTCATISRNTHDKKRTRTTKRYEKSHTTFKTIEEEAAFWDTHSSEEFSDELTPVENFKFVKTQPKKVLTIRFDEATFEKLAKEAKEKGIGPSTLARMVILEHLRTKAS